MEQYTSQPNTRNTLPLLAIAGASAALAAPGANAALITQSGLEQNIAPGTMLADVGGMTGVNIDFTEYNSIRESYKSALTSDTGGVTLLLSPGTVFGADYIGTLETGVTLSAEDKALPSGVFGVVFDGGAGSQYGWVDITTRSGRAGEAPDTDPFDGTHASVTLNAWGYNDEVGESVVIPRSTQVSEPTSLMLLALGVTGFAAARRRKFKGQVSN